MKIFGILHATFLVADLERSRRFYEGVLGLIVDANRPDLGYPGVWYGVASGQQIHLMQLIDLEPGPEAGYQRSGHGGRDRHVALAVDDLVGLAVLLDTAGVSYTNSRSGRKALFCRDPDGNALEFVGMGEH